jgi:hypothetical protein
MAHSDQTIAPARNSRKPITTLVGGPTAENEEKLARYLPGENGSTTELAVRALVTLVRRRLRGSFKATAGAFSENTMVWRVNRTPKTRGVFNLSVTHSAPERTHSPARVFPALNWGLRAEPVAQPSAGGVDGSGMGLGSAWLGLEDGRTSVWSGSRAVGRGPSGCAMLSSVSQRRFLTDDNT